jgi:polygalacturonase
MKLGRLLRLVGCWFMLAGLRFSAPYLQAQDTRTVSEPKYPPICKILYANLTPHGGMLPDEPIERHYRDNDRIEKAMDECPAGRSVVLHGAKTGKSVFLIGPLKLRAGITLVVDQSAAVWGSRDPRNYDVAPGSCGIVGERGPGCLPLILAEDAPHSGIMGEGVIDGRGGARLLNQNETWWELAHRAKVEDANQAVSRILVVRRSNDFTLYKITLRNSPNCHVSTEETDGFTAWGVRIDTPKWARNTDGIDPQSGSTNISIIDSYIRAGDDNISPKASAAPVTHMTVRDTHFYNGHGFGIGSQTQAGLSAIRVDHLTIDGSDNGLRIKSDKSRGGLVDDVRFENVCMRGVTNPIVLNPFYTTFDGNKIPVYRGIALDHVHSLSSGTLTLAGLDPAHRLEATLDDVFIDGVKPGDITARHAVFTIHGGNLEPTGEDVRISGSDGGGTPLACEARFVPFPENTVSPISQENIPPEDKTFYVAADGTGDYYSVQAALNKVPMTGGVVLVAPGVYRERLSIRQNHVTLRSANRDASRTVIVSNLSRATRGAEPGAATVRVSGDDFLAENLTFENDYARPAPDAPGAQAPALRLMGDRNVLRNVRLLGNQGTVYLGAKNCGDAAGTNCDAARTYITRSYIAGNVNFIMGDGLAFFDDCEIHSLPHTAGGFITAQGKHYQAQESGFVFRIPRFTAEPGVKNVLLGRPWRDLAEVVLLNPQLGAQIASAGFGEWKPGVTHRLETSFFRIYAPTGPGAPTSTRQLTAAEAARYGVHEMLAGKDGWDPLEVR